MTRDIPLLGFAAFSGTGKTTLLCHLLPLLKARCITRFKKRPGRTEFQRAIVERDTDGGLVVRSTGMQGSGILHSMSLANCFAVLPEEAGDIEPGALVDVQPFFGLV